MANKSVYIFKPDMKDLNINVNKEEESLKNKSLNWLPVANCFSGREDIFKEIKKEFTDKKCVVLHGMPGIGKTETARQFGSRNCDFFNGNLIWIFSETSDNIKQCFVNLATALHLKITDASLIFNQFKTSKALIIFDNAESMAAIKSYLPSKQLHPTVYVLITSRLSKWGPSTSISKIHLDLLNVEDSLSIFKQKIGDKFDEYKPEKWKELVRKLDGIPLCIQIVSSLIHQEVYRIRLTEFNLENFIDEMEAKLISSTTSEFEQDYDQKSVFAAINSVLSRFDEVKAISALALLCYVAYLDADRIDDIDLLSSIPSIVESKPKLEEALNKLVDYSLIQIVKDSYFPNMKIKVHRTVQLVLRNYDLNQRKGIMFKTLLGLSLTFLMSHEKTSIFKYADKEEFLEKISEFYNENHENEVLIKTYAENLVEYNCDEALKKILPEFKNDRINKFIQMLFYAINSNRDMKTIQVFFLSVAENKKDARQIEALLDWRSTKLIDTLFDSNTFKTSNNILKSLTKGEFLHSLVLNSNKENVKETIECINQLVSKWGADILYQDDNLNNILHTACLNEEISFRIIEYLFHFENGKLKEIVDCQNKFDNKPLHYLLHWNICNPDVHKIIHYFICECKADITIQDKNKRNILFYICWKGSFETIEFILRERDCSQIIYDQDKNGNIAFSQLFRNDLIEKADRTKLIDYFLENKKKINKPEIFNVIIKKMLYEAVFAKNNSLEIIKLLIENGATLEITDDIPYWPSIEFFETIWPAIIVKDKISVANRFLHSLILNSSKEKVIETIECINHLISKWGAEILYQDDNSNNILHIACRNSKICLEIIEYLFQLENGILKRTVDCQNNFKETPLHVLFYWNDNNSDVFEIFRYFICEHKADITIQNENKRNILFYICSYGSFGMIEFILKERDCSQIIYDQDEDGDVVFSQLFWNRSIKKVDRIKSIDYFLENKKKLKKPENYNEIINKMLYQAVFARNNNLEIFQVLIENGAILDITDNDIPGWPSIKLIDTLLQANLIKNKISAANKFLHSLVLNSNKENVIGTIECINHLISKRGADILYQDDYLENNILHTACRNSEVSSKIIEYLFQLENGKLKEIADSQNEDNQTPLHYLFICNKDNLDLFEIFRFFITKFQAAITKNDEDGQNENKEIPFHMSNANKKKYLDLFEILPNFKIECRAEQNKQGWNILFLICKNGTFEIIKFILKERDCTQIINDKDKDGNVAISQLIWNDSIEDADRIELFNLFLEYGMDINFKNKEDKTLLEIAEEYGLNTLTEVIKKYLKELEHKASKRMKR